MKAYTKLKKKLNSGEIVILDGATGTELQRRGVAMNPQAWCGPATLENDAILTEIHSDYITAGAEVITANTFASSRLMLGPAGYGGQVEEINRRAVEAALKAREATNPDVVVAGSLSHMVPVSAGSATVDPDRVPDDSEISDAFHELAHIHKASGVDLIILEMMYEPGRIRLAVEAALATGLPIWFGMSARAGVEGGPVSFHQFEDIPISEVVKLIPAQGIDAAGIMHTRIDLVEPALKALSAGFSGAVMAYPDSGHFEMPDWVFREVISPDDLEALFLTWLRTGVQIIGGCCGLTVAHIEAAVRARDAFQASGK